MKRETLAAVLRGKLWCLCYNVDIGGPCIVPDCVPCQAVVRINNLERERDELVEALREARALACAAVRGVSKHRKFFNAVLEIEQHARAALAKVGK